MSKCLVKLSNIKSCNFVQQLSRRYNQPTRQTDIHNNRKSNLVKLVNNLKFSLWTLFRLAMPVSLTRTSQRTTKYITILIPWSCQFVRFYDSTTDDRGERRGDVSCQQLQRMLLRTKQTYTYWAKDGRFCSFVKELYSTELCTAATETLTVMPLGH